MVSLFDYFSHIELIPLETNDDVVIGRISKVVYHQNRYHVLDRHPAHNVVLLFDDAGKFLFQIGRQGNGAGEYITAYDVIINPFTGDIDILCVVGGIHSFDLQGNYLYSSGVIINDELLSIWNVAAINEKTYVLLHGTNPFKIFYYDLDEKRIFHREREENLYANRATLFRYFFVFYEFMGQWFYWEATDRVTYKLGPDSLVKAYTWDFGRFNYDISEMYFPERYRNDWDGKVLEYTYRLPYRFLTQGQNNRYIMAQIMLSGGKLGNLMFDKSTQKAKFIEHFTESVDFRPLVVTNGYVLSFSNHEDIENFITTEMLDESNRRKFEALLDAEEEQNPIIIKYFFK